MSQLRVPHPGICAMNGPSQSASRNATTQCGHDNRPLYPRGEPLQLGAQVSLPTLDQPLQRICPSSSFCLVWSDQLQVACRTLWGRLSGGAEEFSTDVTINHEVPSSRMCGCLSVHLSICVSELGV